MKFKVTTSCTAITEYIVEASSREEAEETYFDGGTLSEEITDYHDEEVLNIEEVK